MWKLSAALLLMPILAMAGISGDKGRADVTRANDPVGNAVQNAKSDWEKADFSMIPSADAAARPAVSMQTVAMVASY